MGLCPDAEAKWVAEDIVCLLAPLINIRWFYTICYCDGGNLISQTSQLKSFQSLTILFLRIYLKEYCCLQQHLRVFWLKRENPCVFIIHLLNRESHNYSLRVLSVPEVVYLEILMPQTWFSPFLSYHCFSLQYFPPLLSFYSYFSPTSSLLCGLSLSRCQWSFL